eukprot:CAMPEP_0177702374 /NCGR_PEP_ID=MMETSP0484_2-20121128/7103_1 /TAXON_ID=354590 /ORGANISM="Rhodomonas lens, Strain RHODO" /LENGTH=65 /DNA_ID=CAMNT_0019213655 /DNA_START=95 /DNA_END=289 /DNA_ORIENTATION=-
MKKSEITAADDELDEEDVEIYEATPPQRGNGRNQEEEIEMQELPTGQPKRPKKSLFKSPLSRLGR